MSTGIGFGIGICIGIGTGIGLGIGVGIGIGIGIPWAQGVTPVNLLPPQRAQGGSRGVPRRIPW